MSQACLVVLGASNVARGFPALVAHALRLWGQPLDLVVAKGHGRSYGIPSQLLGRSLPGIRECGFLEALNEPRSRPLHALVTDIGNDLPYGVPVGEILAWITHIFEQLIHCGADVSLLPLPMDNLGAVPPWKYTVLLRTLYPRCQTPRHNMLAQAEALNDGVCAAARMRGIRVLNHEPCWYGFDPIHIRRRQIGAAWEHILRAVRSGPCNGGPSASRSRGARRNVRFLRPLRFGLFGREFHTPQPCRRFADGTRIHLY